MQTSKLCRYCYNKLYAQKNKEKIRARQNNYYHINKKQISITHKKYRNRPEVAARIKEIKHIYRQTHKEYELQKSREYKARPEYKIKRKQFRNQRYKTDIQYNLNSRIRVSLNKSLKKNGRKSKNILGFTFDQLKLHLETTLRNDMTWEMYLQGKIHIDHIIPLEAFEFQTFESESFKLCWSLKNLKLEWDKDNVSKNDKLPNGFPARNLIYKIKNQDDYNRVLNGGLPLADLTNYYCEI